MSYQIRISPLARRQLKKLKGRPEVRDIVQAIDGLANGPHPTHSKKPSGYPFWRINQGDFRIVYSIEDDQLLVLVLKVAQRSDINQSLEELTKIQRKMTLE